jgi:DNA-binding NtrC family response regulator
VFPIMIPPLRERADDIPILATHFVEKFSRDMNKKLAISLAALDELKAYSWPGNVRELQNCIERAVILCDADAIQPRHLNLSFRTAHAAAPAVSPWDQIDLSGSMADALRRVTAEVEKRKIEQAIRDSGNNKQRAADILQISYKTLLQKLKEYGIEDS